MTKHSQLRLPIALGFLLAAVFLPFSVGAETFGESPCADQSHATAVSSPRAPASYPPLREQSDSKVLEIDLDRAPQSPVLAALHVATLPHVAGRAGLAISLQTLHVRLDL